eukprot:403334782
MDKNLTLAIACLLIINLDSFIPKVQAIESLDLSEYTNWLTIFLGWLIGFTPRASVAGVEQCIPSLIYSLEAAVLIRYDQTQGQQNGGIAGYALDLYSNIFRLMLELFGSWAYCSTSLFRIFGTSANIHSHQTNELTSQFLNFSSNKSINHSTLLQQTNQRTTMQFVFDWINYFLPLLQAAQAYFSMKVNDGLLFGLYSGEIFGTSYAYLAEKGGFTLFD